MIGFDVDEALLSGRDLLLVLDRLDHAGNRGAGKAEEQDLLTGAKVPLGNLRRLEDGDGGLAGARPACDQEMTAHLHDILLALSQFHGRPLPGAPPQRRVRQVGHRPQAQEDRHPST